MDLRLLKNKFIPLILKLTIFSDFMKKLKFDSYDMKLIKKSLSKFVHDSMTTFAVH